MNRKKQTPQSNRVILAMLVAVVVVSLMSTPLPAVVVTATTENVTPPPDDPGWFNVGIVKNSTAIYLGNRWMMTAAHVGPADVTFPDLGIFSIDSSTIFQLKNPRRPGLSDETDIVLFQLVEDPGLPPLRLTDVQPPIGAEVIMIGHGRNREDDRTYWDVDDSNRRNWIWDEAVTPPGNFSGFRTLPNNTLRWGTNLIENDDLHENRRDPDITTVVETNGDVVALITEFDFDDGNSDRTITANGEFITEFESQAVLNDSGGPLFYQREGIWLLVGMAVAVDGFTTQPDVTRNPVFGNLSYFADLASYRDQIETRFLYGDFNNDGQRTVADIDLMSHAALSDQYEPNFDLNRDGQVDLLDRTIWVEDLMNTFFGDTDLDGEFSSGDLIKVFQAAEYEDSIPLNSTWAEGDWNGDLEFTTSDFVKAFQAGGYDIGPRLVPGEATAAVIPEPGAMSLSMVGLIILAAMRRRRCFSC